MAAHWQCSAVRAKYLTSITLSFRRHEAQVQVLYTVHVLALGEERDRLVAQSLWRCYFNIIVGG